MFLVDSLLNLINYKLKSLDVSGKYVDEAIKLTINNNKETLTELYCAYTQITNLPDMPNLEQLSCLHTQLKSLPNMPNLKILNCSNTQITNLPNMPNLKILYCHGTQISLPDMPNLKELCCSFTQLTNLPYMPKLEHLSCKMISLVDYRKMYKIRKTLLILATLQVITSKSILNTIDITGFNIARLVKNFL